MGNQERLAIVADSVVRRDPVVPILVELPDLNALVFCDKADDLLSNVFHVVVLLEQIDVLLHCSFCRMPV